MAAHDPSFPHVLFADHDDAAGVRLDALAALLESGLSVEIVARGRSMEPIIPDATRLTLAPVAAHTVRVGDVIALRHASNVRIHRIVAVSRDADEPLYIARGDSSGTIDPPRYAPDLLGRVIRVQTPNGRNHDLRRASWQRLNVVLGHVSRHQLWTVGRWPHSVADAPRYADRPRPDVPPNNRAFRIAHDGYRLVIWQIFLTLAWGGVRWLK